MTQVLLFFFFSVFESQLTRPILRDVSGSDRSPSSQLETQLKLIKTTSAVQFNCHSIIGSGWESKRDSFSFPPKTTMAGWRNWADYPWPMLKLRGKTDLRREQQDPGGAMLRSQIEVSSWILLWIVRVSLLVNFFFFFLPSLPDAAVTQPWKLKYIFLSFPNQARFSRTHSAQCSSFLWIKENRKLTIIHVH